MATNASRRVDPETGVPEAHHRQSWALARRHRRRLRRRQVNDYVADSCLTDRTVRWKNRRGFADPARMHAAGVTLEYPMRARQRPTTCCCQAGSRPGAGDRPPRPGKHPRDAARLKRPHARSIDDGSILVTSSAGSVVSCQSGELQRDSHVVMAGAKVRLAWIGGPAVSA